MAIICSDRSMPVMRLALRWRSISIVRSPVPIATSKTLSAGCNSLTALRRHRLSIFSESRWLSRSYDGAMRSKSDVVLSESIIVQ